MRVRTARHQSVELGPEFIESRTSMRAYGNDRCVFQECPGDVVGDIETRQFGPLVIDRVHLGERHDAMTHAEQLQDAEVLLGLRLPAFGRGHDEQACVNRAHTGEHVLEKLHVPRHIDESDSSARGKRGVGKSEIDREPLASFPPPNGRGRYR